MEEHPDSALIILNNIDSITLKGNKERAKYALLKTIALDKNYIDKTTCEILQPAIDYYLKEGTADEILKTLYYRGRIYQNAEEYTKAMTSFISGRELFDQSSDSLTIARLLAAQGAVNYELNRFDVYINNNIIASKIYHSLNLPYNEVVCLCRALQGASIIEEKEISDSIANACIELTKSNIDHYNYFFPYYLVYQTTFCSNEEILNTLNSIPKDKELEYSLTIDIANAYIKLGDTQKADSIINSLSIEPSSIYYMKYLSTKVILEDNSGNYQKALNYYKTYFDTVYQESTKITDLHFVSAEDNHTLELDNIQISKNERKSLIIAIVIISSLLIFIVIIYYKNIQKSKRLIISSKLQEQNKNLELAKQNAEHARNEQQLISENLQLKISVLEEECEQLKSLLKNKESLSNPIETAIKERIELLNNILATKISNDDTLSESHSSILENIIEDRDSFMNSTRLAFKASHPQFIKYLEDHNLSDQEINYLCLYAIGLRGKEVGEYIKNRRHYHVSSEIRKKLEIDEHQTNIGIYIRKLMKSL